MPLDQGLILTVFYLSVSTAPTWFAGLWGAPSVASRSHRLQIKSLLSFKIQLLNLFRCDNRESAQPNKPRSKLGNIKCSGPSRSEHS